MPIYKFQRAITAGPSGTTLYFRNADVEPRAVELAEVDGWIYVFVPAAAVLPAQPAGIAWQPATLTGALTDQIKVASRPCYLISDRMQQMIRGSYSLEDELYYARIGLGVALGAYTFQPGEQAALLTFGAYVESVRQWGRDRRAEIGLS